MNLCVLSVLSAHNGFIVCDLLTHGKYLGSHNTSNYKCTHITEDLRNVQGSLKYY